MHNLSKKQHDTVLAGLRLLQTTLDNRLVLPNDGNIGDILTDGGSHAGLTATEIDTLCEEINCGKDGNNVVVIEINGGVVNTVSATHPVRVIILDQDVEGGVPDNIQEINGEDVYISDYHLDLNEDVSKYVDNIVSQLDDAKREVPHD